MGLSSTRRTETLAHTLDISEIETILLSFSELVEAEGWSVPSGSELEQWLLFPGEWPRMRVETSSIDALAQQRRDIRGVLGLCELARHLMHARGLPVYERLRPHLRLFVEATAPAQNVRSKQDEGANKLFELLIALLLARGGATDLELEKPRAKSALTRNPDVLFKWRDGLGGVACKVLDSADPRAFVRNLEKGLRQIQASSAEFGCVFFNLKNIVPEDLLLPLATNQGDIPGIRAFTSLDGARREVSGWIGSYLDEVRECLTPDLWDRFNDQRLEPEVELYFADTCIVQHEAGFRINTVKFISTIPLGGRATSPRFSDLIDAINDAQGEA